MTEEKILTKPVNPAKRSSSTKLKSALMTLFNISMFCALCVLAYVGYTEQRSTSVRLQHLETNQENSMQQSQQYQESLNQQMIKLQSQVLKIVAQASNLTDEKIATLSEHLSATDHKVLLFAGRHRTDWLLAEADYLVRIANNRLLHERDSKTALALLVSAEERIVLMDDPSLLSIREALSKDMAALRLTKHDDVALIAIRITGLLSQISELPLQRFDLPEESSEEPEPIIDTTDQTWQQGLRKTFKELSVKWFDLKKHERQVKPMISETSERIIKNNMSLLLQTAQFATLKQQQKLYINSVEQLLTWLTEYYDQENIKVINFKEELNRLKTLTIYSDVPQVLESRLAISREVEERLVRSITIKQISEDDAR